MTSYSIPNDRKFSADYESHKKLGLKIIPSEDMRILIKQHFYHTTQDSKLKNTNI